MLSGSRHYFHNKLCCQNKWPSAVWNITECYQRRSFSRNQHYTRHTTDFRANQHYPGYRHDRSNHIQFGEYDSQVTYAHHKRWDLQHCYHHSSTQYHMAENTQKDILQGEARFNKPSAYQSPVCHSSNQKQSHDPSVGDRNARQTDNPLSWKQSNDPSSRTYTSHANDKWNRVNKPMYGWQRDGRTDQKWKGQSFQQWRHSSHGAEYSSNSASRPIEQKPSEEYMTLSQQPSIPLEEPVPKKLLVLDLNGTLASRTKSRDSMFVRPYQDKFIDYIFRYFDVMVWSSAQPHSVANMCQLFEDHVNELILKWDRTMLGLTRAQYNKKSVTIKDLEKVWKALDSKYDATNTILLDDSPIKAQLQPYNSIHLREFSHTSPTFCQHGESELLHVLRYLEQVRLQSNVCSFMKGNPFVPPDPTLDEDNENMFEVYHYVFSQKGRRLKDFRPKDEEDVTQVARLLEGTKI